MTHLDYKNVQQDLGMVVYEFDHQEHSIDIKPHGNSTEKLTRTKPSTIHLWKTEVEKKAPIKVLRNVENIKRGIMKAASSGICLKIASRFTTYNKGTNLTLVFIY